MWYILEANPKGGYTLLGTIRCVDEATWDIAQRANTVRNEFIAAEPVDNVKSVNMDEFESILNESAGGTLVETGSSESGYIDGVKTLVCYTRKIGYKAENYTSIYEIQAKWVDNPEYDIPMDDGESNP